MFSKRKKIIIVGVGVAVLAVIFVYVYYSFFYSRTSVKDYGVLEGPSGTSGRGLLSPGRGQSALQTEAAEELIPFEQYTKPGTQGLPQGVKDVYENISDVDRINRINAQIERMASEEETR